MPEQDEVKLPPMPEPLITMRRIRGCEGEAAAQLALESFAISYARTAVLAERERVIKACRDLNAATDGRARGQDYVDAILGDWDGAVMRIFHRVGKGTP